MNKRISIRRQIKEKLHDYGRGLTEFISFIKVKLFIHYEKTIMKIMCGTLIKKITHGSNAKGNNSEPLHDLESEFICLYPLLH